MLEHSEVAFRHGASLRPQRRSAMRTMSPAGYRQLVFIGAFVARCRAHETDAEPSWHRHGIRHCGALVGG